MIKEVMKAKTEREAIDEILVFVLVVLISTFILRFTRKQLDYMKSKGKPYTFVDCDKKGCDDIDGYPTLIHSDGRKIVGFNQV